MQKTFSALLFALILSIITLPALAKAGPITFAVPPWPGAMVKAEIAIQVLEAIGFTTSKTSMEAKEAYAALENGQVDVFMSAWLPLQKEMLMPLVTEKKVHIAGVNVAHARTGLCVPGYVEAAGVQSIADLAPNAAKFNSTIQNLEAGSGIHNVVNELIQNNFEGLGSWKQEGDPIDLMMKHIIASFKEKKWIVFGCWEPHWMNITLDMRYLKGDKGSGMLTAPNEVNTIVSSIVKKDYPDPYLFLSRINIDKQTQGKWTYDVSIKKQTIEETATYWIKGHLNIVRQWLGNTKAATGERAVDVIQTKF